MREILLAHDDFPPDFAAWRTAVRPLLAARVPPREVTFVDADTRQTALPGLAPAVAPPAATLVPSARVRIPAAFVALGETAACHRDPGRWDLLYRVAHRLTGSERRLLADATDPDVHRLHALAAAVERDVHKMHAFVRFRRITDADGEHYIAWHQPDHFVVKRAAPFFVERFSPMRWSILTPDGSAHWDGTALGFGPGLPRSAAPRDDELEGLWQTYYASVFNPARLNLRAQARELPRRHWPTLPEAALIAPLAEAARHRVSDMIVTGPTSAAPFVPGEGDLATLAAAARGCEGCPLHRPATQTVFGEGPADARIMLVGEQPGDEEDQRGRPFVGPAGAILDAALAAVGLDRRRLYVTNAVKHFKFQSRGKRRLHEKPNGRDVQACKPWLLAEIERLRPQVIVALGGTAGQALFGPSVRPVRDRGRPLPSALAPLCLVTYHPSAVLRATDPTAARQIERDLRADLARAAASVDDARVARPEQAAQPTLQFPASRDAE